MECADLLQLSKYMAWADAIVWAAILRVPGAADDKRVRWTLHHIHMVQHIFAVSWRGQPISMPSDAELTSHAALVAFARGAHQSIQTFLSQTPAPDLQRAFREPWTDQFDARWPKPAASHTLGESVLQVVLHTSHHRGQLCSRLREFGSDPPTLDFIVWLWGGRPEPDWSLAQA
jgi:uncharacterized damage-inducible protein DinB